MYVITTLQSRMYLSNNKYIQYLVSDKSIVISTCNNYVNTIVRRELIAQTLHSIVCLHSTKVKCHPNLDNAFVFRFVRVEGCFNYINWQLT